MALSNDASVASRGAFCLADACTTISSDTHPEMTRAVDPSCNMQQSGLFAMSTSHKVFFKAIHHCEGLADMATSIPFHSNG